MDNSLASARLGVRCLGEVHIVSERIDPRMLSIGQTWEWLRFGAYAMADALVMQTQPIAVCAAHQWGNGNVHVIGNPVTPPSIVVSSDLLCRRSPFMVAVGRLIEQKGFDLLLRAFARMSPIHPEWNLVILGEGPERGKLQALAERLGIAESLYLPGLHRNPYEVMRAAALFVLSSRYEGFPNVLVEAMACGLPVISFDCPSGPGEIIRDGIDGVLVPAGNVDALAEAMQGLVCNEKERNRLSARAPEVLARFSQEAVMGKWERLLQELVQTE